MAGMIEALVSALLEALDGRPHRVRRRAEVVGVQDDSHATR